MIETIPKKSFHVNEKVLVYQGPMLYDAKITKSFDPVNQKINYYDEKRKEFIVSSPDKKFPNKFLSEVCYMVHYQGWNVKWDEWVIPSRILEINNESLMLKRNIQEEIEEQNRLKLAEQEKLEREKKKESGSKIKDNKTKKIGKDGNRRINKNDKGDPLKNIKLHLNGATIDSIINNHGNINNNNDSNGKSSRIGKKKKDDNVDNGRIKSTSIKTQGSSSSVGENINNSRYENGLIEGDIDGVDASIKNSICFNQKKGKGGSTHYESQNGFTHHEIKVLVPDELKIILVNDWENITKNNKLVALPSKISVTETLKDFVAYLQSEFNDDESELSILLEITESMKQYFEQSLGAFVLYRYERPQYNEIILKESSSNLYDVYGPIFLLRLLSIFPNILVMNEVDATTIRVSKVYLDIILHWLNINKEKYLTVEYENQSPWISIMHG
jgi:mortality factor 4-like protein 1